MIAPVDDALVSVLLVDDDQTFVRQVARYLDGTATLRVVGKAYNSAEAVQQIDRVRPDLVLLDWRLGPDCGVKVIPQFKERVPSVRTIMLTMMEPSYRDEALACGADGFVHKFQIVDDLLLEIERVMHAKNR